MQRLQMSCRSIVVEIHRQVGSRPAEGTPGPAPARQVDAAFGHFDGSSEERPQRQLQDVVEHRRPGGRRRLCGWAPAPSRRTRPGPAAPGRPLRARARPDSGDPPNRSLRDDEGCRPSGGPPGRRLPTRWARRQARAPGVPGPDAPGAHPAEPATAWTPAAGFGGAAPRTRPACRWPEPAPGAGFSAPAVRVSSRVSGRTGRGRSLGSMRGRHDSTGPFMTPAGI